jgi:hypothetical protein
MDEARKFWRSMADLDCLALLIRNLGNIGYLISHPFGFSGVEMAPLKIDGITCS